MKGEKQHYKGYTIEYNELWGKFQVSHEQIGKTIAEFDSAMEAQEYCNNG